MIAAVETELEPPAPSRGQLVEEPGDHEVDVTLWITETDGSRRSASIAMPVDADCEDLADALTACVRAVAQLHGPGLVEAIGRRVR